MERLNEEQLEQFCLRLSKLISAGITAQESVYLMLEEESELPPAWLQALQEALSVGAPLSEALASVGGVPHDMLQMVSIGDATGNVERVLANLAKYYNNQRELRSALKRAVGYPALMAGLIVLVFSIVLTQVLPVFSRVFQQIGAGIPQALLRFVEMGTAGRVAIYALCAVILIAAGYVLWRIEKGSRLPLGKKVDLAVNRNRFSSSFAMLLSSGMAIDGALEKAADMLKDSSFAQPVAQATQLFEQGNPLPQCLSETGVLSKSDASYLSVATRSGVMDEAMAEISERCATESERILALSMGRFEFAIVLILCLLVVMILLAVIVPLIGVLTAIS